MDQGFRPSHCQKAQAGLLNLGSEAMELGTVPVRKLLWKLNSLILEDDLFRLESFQ